MTQPPGPQTITKKELVNRIAEQTGQTKVIVKDILQKFLDEIIEELCRGNRLEFREFGVFEVKERAPRRAQNPRTLEKVEVPGKRVVKYKVGRLMRERVCEERPPEPAPPPAAPKRSGAPAPAAVQPAPPPAPPKPPPSNSPF
ncbi:MAG: integration host factor subunit beta [Planctomycetes bacterium]|nr:integration host factor subunit beta [Planctomycetota bacterium]